MHVMYNIYFRLTACTAPLPYLQKIISHPARVIRYETVADLQNPLWCIDGVGAISSLDNFGDIAPEGHNLTYTNPLSSDVANNKVLYLVDHATNNCTDINSAVEISSAVGNINSAILIMLHIVEGTCVSRYSYNTGTRDVWNILH